MKSVTDLQAVSQKLRLITSQVAERNYAPAITAGELRELVSILRRIGVWLRSKNSASTTALENDVQEYRKNLEHLHRALPAFHAWLLVESTRLERDCAHSQAASNWADCNKDTFES